MKKSKEAAESGYRVRKAIRYAIREWPPNGGYSRLLSPRLRTPKRARALVKRLRQRGRAGVFAEKMAVHL